MLTVEDLSPAFIAGDALLQDYALNVNILDELLEATGATDHGEVMNSVEDDLDEHKSLQTKLHRLVTIRKTYVDSVIVKAKTKLLLTSRNLSGTEERKQYDALLLHISQVGAVLKSHYDNNRLLHRHYLDNLTHIQKFGCRENYLDYLQIKLNSAVKGLKVSNDYIYTAGQIIVAILANMFDKCFMQGWRQHIHELVDPPDTSHLQSFLDSMHNSSR